MIPSFFSCSWRRCTVSIRADGVILHLVLIAVSLMYIFWRGGSMLRYFIFVALVIIILISFAMSVHGYKYMYGLRILGSYLGLHDIVTFMTENSHLKTDKQEIHEKRQQMEIELQKARLALEEANRNQVTLNQT